MMTDPLSVPAPGSAPEAMKDRTDIVTVQSYAHVIGVDESWTVIAASDGCEEVSGHSAETMLGRPVAEVLDVKTLHALRSKAQVLNAGGPVARMQGLAVADRGLTLDVTVTVSGGCTFFEFEPAETRPRLSTEVEQIQRLILRVARKTDLSAAVLEGASTLSALSGFERVTVHPVTRSGLGPAIGISTAAQLTEPPDVASLRAHAANFCAYLHLIPDIAAAAPRLLHRLSEPESGLANWAEPRVLCSYGVGSDLKHALDAEGAAAALTIPIRKGGELWGVFVCHHHTPVSLSVGARSALDLFALLFGYELERLDEKIGARARREAGELRDVLMSRLGRQPDYAAAVREIRPEVNRVIPHDGLVLWHHGQFMSDGAAVSQQDFEPIFTYLSQNANLLTTGINRLSEVGVRISGIDVSRTAVLVIRLSRNARDYLLFFRTLGPNDDSIGTWRPWEIEAATVLRGGLVEAALKLTEDAREMRLRTQEHQGLLIAELNHRVRNILNLIRGLVGQSKTGAHSVEEYAEVLEERVNALSCAHDELTEKEWSWVDIRSALNRELAPYMDVAAGEGPMAVIEGDSVDVSPAAFSTMALVVHELVSNARKFGALSVAQGRVSVSLARDAEGFLSITWEEAGGPRPKLPDTGGFGLTIIEQSVPYELRGTSRLDFTPTGLHAEFRLPPGHISLQRPQTEEAVLAEPEAEPEGTDISIDGIGMILDDSLVISMDAADILRAAGATDVHACNSVESALDALDTGDVSFALLDVNLGVETSLAVAEQLWNDGIPAALATGYGANEDMLADFPPMPILTKPYTLADVQDVLRAYRDSQTQA